MPGDEKKTQFAHLDNTNYPEWVVRMEAQLIKVGLWDVVVYETDIDARKDPEEAEKALAAWQKNRTAKKMAEARAEIVLKVEDSQLVHMQSRDPMVIWQSLAQVHVARGFATRLALQRQFMRLVKGVDETMAAWVGHVKSFSFKLEDVGVTVTDADRILTLTGGLDDSYEVFISSLDAMLSPETTLDYVVDRLLNEEMRRESKDSVDGPKKGTALITKDNESRSCWRCGKTGHIKMFCKEKLEDNAQEKKRSAPKEEQANTAYHSVSSLQPLRDLGDREVGGRASMDHGLEASNSGGRGSWDGVMNNQITRIGHAPPPQQDSATAASSGEALGEKEQSLMDTIEIIHKHHTSGKGAIAQSLTLGHRNPLAPVMRLPPEILSRVFIFHARLSDSWLEAALTSTHVCRRWQQIGLDCSRLWSHIECENYYSGAWMAKLAERSRSVPLSLVVTELAAVDPQTAALNMHRFRSLDLDVIEGDRDSFFELFSKPAPLLQDLELASRGYRGFAFPSNFLGGNTPNLRHVKLFTNRCVLWDSGLFTNLVTLDVTENTVWIEHDDPDRPPLQLLLSALARMPGLEILILCWTLPPDPPMTVSAHVHLPNLRRLIVEGGVRDCTWFLKQVTFNPSTVVVLKLNCFCATKEELPIAFSSHLFMTPRPIAQALKVTWWTSTPRDLKIHVWIAGQDRAVENASIEIVISYAHLSRGSGILELACACFASHQLHSFRLSGGGVPGWGSEFWRKLAHMAPDLQRLAPGGAQSAELCKALCPPDGQDLVPADCCFPVLSYLELATPCDHPTPMPDGNAPLLSEDLSRCLSTRAGIGCSTPELVFTASREVAPDDWSQPFDAAPGTAARENNSFGETM